MPFSAYAKPCMRFNVLLAIKDNILTKTSAKGQTKEKEVRKDRTVEDRIVFIV